MDSIVTKLSNLLSNPNFQPYLENLKKQNEEFIKTETTKLLMDEDDAEGDGFEDEEKGETDKEIAMGLLKKMAKLFEYASLGDRCVLFVGVLFTIVHAASFPILAILFGKISNAFVASRLLEMQNTTLHPPHNHTSASIGATGELALKFLTKVASKVNPGVNASVIPDASEVSGGGYFGDVNPFHSNGTETTEDFATYVADFSLYYVYIGIAVFISSFIQTASWEWVAENQVYRIKQKFIYQLLRQEQSWFSKHTAGSIVLKIADDVERFREGIGQKFSLIVEYISIALFGAGIGLLTNFKLTLVFLASGPFILTKLLLLWKKIAQKNTVQQKEYAKAGQICSEVISGIRIVTPYSGEQKEIARYSRALAKGAAAAQRVDTLTGIGIGGMYLLIYSFYAVALWYAVNLLAQGVITPGEIYTVFFSLTICAFALGSLLPFVNSIAASFGSIHLLETILESVPKIDPYSTTGERPKNFAGNIKFTNVTFAYPGREDVPVFKDLQLNIPGGMMVAIVGPCSSGKSTLINLLLRFYDPQKGQIRLDNYEIKKLNVRWIREQIGVAEQNANLYPTTILENIRSGRSGIKVQHCVAAAKKALAHEFIMALPKKYATELKLPGGKDLSIGQRQRICIARIIIANPKILVLDEAMSAISVQDAQEIEKNLKSMRKGMTTIIIAHKLAVARNAGYIIVLKDGKVAQRGAHEELIEDEDCTIYSEMLQHENLVDQLEESQEDAVKSTEADAEAEIAEEYMQASSAQQQTSSLLAPESETEGKCKKKHKPLPSISKLLAVLPNKCMSLFLGFLGCALSGIVIPILAFCLGQILEMFLGDKEDLFVQGIFWVEILIVLAITSGIGYCLRTVFIGKLGEDLTQRLRIRSYEAILRQPVSWFDFEKNSPGFLYARLASDIPFIKTAVGPRLGTAISALVTMISGLIIATIYGWELALITSLIIPILLLGVFYQSKTLRHANRKFSITRKNIIRWINRSIKTIWMIQATSSMFYICQRMEDLFLPALAEGQKQAIMYGFAYATSECLMFFTFGAAFRVGAELIRLNILSVPNLFTIFFVITFGSLSLGQATSYVPEYYKARFSAHFIMKLIHMKSPVDPFDPNGLEPEIRGRIELRNVAFKYPLLPDVKILQGTDLVIPAKCTIGIVGPVGGGKSTLLSILLRFYEIDSGEILIDGVDIKNINLKYWRENIGYVAQEPNLFDITIRENILYGYNGDADADELNTLVEAAAMAADADFITDELPQQYETRCGEHGANLNSGQRQEIAIARAIMKNPPILLLDDPTSSLDAQEEQHVQAALHRVTRDRTCIVVSNSYSSIKYCEYIAVLIKGKIVEYGKQEELLKSKGIYYRFVMEQGVRLLNEVEEEQEDW